MTAFPVVCLKSISTSSINLDISNADEKNAIVSPCPQDICIKPSIATIKSTLSYATLDVPVETTTRTIFSVKFRTKALNGLIGLIEGPAYLAIYLSNGRVAVALNTKGTGIPAVGSTARNNFNDGNWKSVRIVRTGNIVELTDEAARFLLRVTYGS